jgi:Pyruvate/2-oxoacid:ferredoxin oxidoreductase gamma subunit
MKYTISISIGGAAGQSVATTGDILAKIVTSPGITPECHNSYQSIGRSV